jgi:Lipoprotein LpqB beta-propeller domain/Sporulation and spore germination
MKPPGRLVAPAIAVTAIATLAGCVSLPTSGRVSGISLSGPNGSQQVSQLVPVPPGANWNPVEIVTGFLAASVSGVSGSLAVAKAYLTPELRRRWHPSRTSPVVIDSSLADLHFAVRRVVAPTNSGLAAKIVYVASNITSNHVATNHVETLESVGNVHAGNIVVSTKQPFGFSLYETSPGHQWRIASLPYPRHLLLTQPDFLRDYQPRDLYLPSATKPQILVPYPDFILAQAQTQEVVQELADELLQSVPDKSDGTGPPGWLNGAVTTAFPPGAKISSVDVSGVQATVNLDLPASASLSHAQIGQMEAQLVWTLTESPYGSGTSGIGSVQLVIRHGPDKLDKLLFPQQFARRVPSVGSGPLYFQAPGVAGHPVIYKEGESGRPIRVAAPAGFGRGAFTDIAVSRGNPPVLGACRGNDVYRAQMHHRSYVVTKQVLPTRCTSVSWDSNGNLWVTSGTTFYLLGPGPLFPLSHERVTSSLDLSAPDTVSSFQVAPDGVRAAMIVRTRKGSEVFVAAISTNPTAPAGRSVPVAADYYLAQSESSQSDVRVGSDITDPLALAWQGPDDLVVLGSRAAGGTRRYVFQVPLNGEPSARSNFAVPHGVQWLTADGLGVAVGPMGSAGTISQSRTWDGIWSRLTKTGSTPAFSTLGLGSEGLGP